MKESEREPVDYSLYAVSACGAPESDLLRAAKNGATILQLREKHLSKVRFLAKAKRVLDGLKAGGIKVPFIIDDDVEAAKACGADGVHVGQSDAALSEARAIMGKQAIIGVSAVNLDQALAAQAGGADYLGVGAVFNTGSKLDAAQVSFNTLRAICHSVHIPVVAIGGIHINNLSQLTGSGADGVAVISELFGNNARIEDNTRLFRMGVDRWQEAERTVMRTKLALLDLDGFLLDSLTFWNDIDRKFLKKHKLLTDAHLAELHAVPNLPKAAEYLQKIGVKQSTEAILAFFHKELDKAYSEKLQLFPGAADFIDKLQARGRRLALVTATDRNHVEAALKRLNILNCFEKLYCTADKHNPKTFTRILCELGAGSTETFFFDDMADLRACAESVGIKTYGSMEEYQ